MIAPSSLSSRSKKASQREDSTPRLITVRHVLNALRKWWPLAVPVGLLSAAAVAAYLVFSFEPQYQASAWLTIDLSQPYVAFPTRDNGRTFVANQVELIRSRLVLEPVLARPEIAGIPQIQTATDPISWLQQGLTVRSVGTSEFFLINFTGPDPEDAAKIVNAVWESYLSRLNSEEQRETARVLELLTDEQERRELEMKRLQENVRELAKERAISDPTYREASIVDVSGSPLAVLQSQRTDQEVMAAVLRARIAALKESYDATPVDDLPVSAYDVDRAIDQNERHQAMEADLQLTEERLREYAAKLKDHENDARYQELEREIEVKKSQLAQYREDIRPTVEAAIRKQEADHRRVELVDLESQLETVDFAIETLAARYEEEVDLLKKSTGESLDLEFMRDDLARAESIYELITDRIIQLRTEQRAPERVVLEQAADIPVRPVETMPYKQLALGMLVAFFAPFALAIGWERWIERISNVEQVQESAELPVISEITTLPRRMRSAPAGSASDMRSRAAVYRESFDSLRTLLLLTKGLSEGQVLTVTSAVNNEGKTSVAIQLASSLARSTEGRVLVIDGDMRSPDVHRVFGVDGTPGLAEVLSGQSSLDETLKSPGDSNIDILPAGRLPCVPHRLVCSGSLPEVLSACRERYQYIVIDTPPILAASEALIFAKASDASLLVAMRDVSRLSQVQRAYAQLVAADAHAVGAVLNGVPTRNYVRHYGHYPVPAPHSKTRNAPHEAQQQS